MISHVIRQGIHYRYKLATVTCQEASTQTPSSPGSLTSPTSHPSPPVEEDSHSADTLAPPILAALKLAREDIVRLQRERDEAQERERWESKRQDQLKKECEVGHVIIT